MLGKSHSKLLLAACGLALASWGGSTANGAQLTGFELRSTSYEDGGMMPVRHSAAAPCPLNGQNISPQLSWTNAPPGSKSFAMIETSMEGGGGLGTWRNNYSHGIGDVNLVVYGIPANVTSLAEGELNAPSPNYIAGKNRFGQTVWRGMCAPPGAASPHHYMIKLFATDLEPKALPPGLTFSELIPRLEGHSLDAAVLIGRFANP